MTEDSTNVPQKRCYKCGEWKPATPEFFPEDKRRQDGLKGRCQLCEGKKKAANRAAYYANNRDRILAQKAARRVNNPRAKTRTVVYRNRTRDKAKEKTRAAAYYAKNRDRIKAKSAAYLTNHREKVRSRQAAWYANNRDRVRLRNKVNGHRRRARKRALPANYTAADWRKCLDYWGHCCAVCGRPQGLWHKLAQDHWIPVSRGGAYVPENIVPLCHGVGGCNNGKHNSDPHEWLVRVYGKQKAAQIERRIHEYFKSLTDDVAARDE